VLVFASVSELHILKHLSTHLFTHSSVVNLSTTALGAAFGFILILQFNPRHPSKHTHIPLAHRPLLLHWLGHNLISHALPANPGLQRHLPVASWHTPLWLQSSGQVLWSQAGPVHAWLHDLQALQSHLPVMVLHVPCPLQSRGHFLCPQSEPKKPSWQVHVPFKHKPWPEHILFKSFVGQPRWLQSLPVYPSEHVHSAASHTP